MVNVGDMIYTDSYTIDNTGKQIYKPSVSAAGGTGAPVTSAPVTSVTPFTTTIPPVSYDESGEKG